MLENASVPQLNTTLVSKASPIMGCPNPSMARALSASVACCRSDEPSHLQHTQFLSDLYKR